MRIRVYNILKKYSSILNIDLLYITKGGFWLTIGHMLTISSGVILSVAFANLIPKESFGTYKYVLSIVGILSIFSLPGINTSLSRSIAQGHIGAAKQAFVSKIYWGLLGAVTSLVLAFYYNIQSNDVLTYSFVIVAFFLPFYDTFTLFNAILQGKKDFKKLTQLNTFVQIFSLIVLVATLLLTQNILLIIGAYFASWTVGRMFAFVYTVKKEKVDPQESDKNMLRYGKHLSLMNVLSTIVYQADKIVLFHFFGAAELAIYSLAQTIPEQIRSIFRNVNILAFPNFSNRSGLEIKQRISSSNKYFMLVMLITFLIYLPLAPYIFKLLYPQYTESILLSQIYALVLLLTPKMLYRTALEAKGRNKELYTLHIVGGFSKIILLFIFVSLYGILGAIWAAIVQEVFLYIFLWFLVNKSAFNSQDTV